MLPDYELPEQNRYSQDDEWVSDAGDGLYRVGITDYAQQQLGDVVFVDVLKKKEGGEGGCL